MILDTLCNTQRQIHPKRQTLLYRASLILTILLTINARVESNTPAEGDAGVDSGIDAGADTGISGVEHENSKERAPIVCLSPGHPSGEGDKYYEAIINRKVAYELESLLTEAGYGAVVTTSDLTAQDLFAHGFDNEDGANWDRLKVQTPEEKAEICNEAGAAYVISIHHNFAYDPHMNQTVVFYGVDDHFECAHEEAAKWAHLTARSLGRVMKTDSSRAFADMHRLGFSLGIVANSDAPTILTEASFYSNPKERERLNSDEYIELEALAIFDAFHTHYQSMIE